MWQATVAAAPVKGCAFIDWALYLRQVWTHDSAPLTAAHKLEDMIFPTKPGLVLTMAEGTMTAAVPFAWVTANSVTGSATST